MADAPSELIAAALAFEDNYEWHNLGESYVWQTARRRLSDAVRAYRASIAEEKE